MSPLQGAAQSQPERVRAVHWHAGASGAAALTLAWHANHGTLRRIQLRFLGSFDRDGILYVVDVAWGRIFRVAPNGEVELFVEYDGEPNGLKIHRDGRIFVADYRHGIMVIDPKTRIVTPFLEHAALDRFKGINDLVFASNGDLYFY